VQTFNPYLPAYEYIPDGEPYYTGGDLNSAPLPSSMRIDAAPSDTDDVMEMIKTAKNALYAFANSNAMKPEIIDYKPPRWRTYLMYIMPLAPSLLCEGICAETCSEKEKK